MRVFASLVIASLATLVAPAAHAGWTASGVAVRSTATAIPVLAACSDGAAPGSGAFVVWQEDAGSGGVIRLQHLLPTGDLDPTYPSDGRIVCATTGKRPDLGLLSDGGAPGSVGALVWWTEGASTKSVFAQHVRNDGSLDPA